MYRLLNDVILHSYMYSIGLKTKRTSPEWVRVQEKAVMVCFKAFTTAADESTKIQLIYSICGSRFEH
jgi:hypothetical protein